MFCQIIMSNSQRMIHGAGKTKEETKITGSNWHLETDVEPTNTNISHRVEKAIWRETKGNHHIICKACLKKLFQQEKIN